MKNSNLLNRLLSYSHEKQKPQRFSRYAVMLIMLLTLGVGQMWAATSDGLVIYFKPNSNWTTNWNEIFKIKWNGDGNHMMSMTQIGTSGVYYAICDGEYTWFYFERYSSSDEYWNKTQGSSTNTYWNGTNNYFEQKNNVWDGGTDGNCNWGVYRPAVSSFTLTKSGGTVLGGNGTSSTPYLVLCGEEITFSVSNVSSTVSDANMTLQYHFKDGESTLQNNTTSSYTLTTSSDPNHVHHIIVEPYNRYNNGNSTGNETEEVYYKTICYYVAGNGGSGSGYEGDEWCDGKGWNNQGSPMTYDATNSDWYITFDNVPASSNLKFAITDGSWTNTWRHTEYNSSCSTNLSEEDANDGDHNAKLTINNPSNITIRFNPSASTGSKICASAVGLINGLDVAINHAEAATAPTISSTYTTTDVPVTITAYAANAGYTWSGWTADGGSITSSSSLSTTWSPGASNKTATANYTENDYNVTITKTTGGTLSSEATVTGHKTTSAALPTANAYPGYRFVNWTVTSGTASITNATSASGATINNMTNHVTVQANFERTYAYLQGRMTVTDATQTTSTHIASTEGGWDKSSTKIEMEYDGSSHVFYLHTYKTPAQLSATQSDQSQWFSFKTCTLHDNINTGTVTYEPTSNTDLDNDTNEEKAVDNSGHDRHFKFNSTTTNGYAIIYFDQSNVWYEIEHKLTYDGNGSTSGSVPITYYLDGTVVTVVPDNTFSRTGYTFAGWNGSDGETYEAGDEITMDQDLTLTAQWTENKSSIYLYKGYNASGGNFTTPSPVSNPYSLGVDTKQQIQVSVNNGYAFAGWRVAGNAAVDNASANPTYAKSDGTKAGYGQVYADWTPRYVLRGSLLDKSDEKGMPGWTITESTPYIVGSNTHIIVTLYPNTEYAYKILDRSDDSEHGQTSTEFQPLGITNRWTLNGSNDVKFKSYGYGEYTFIITEGTNPEVYISYPSSWPMRKRTYLVEGSGDCGSVSMTSTVDALDLTYTLEDGDEVEDGGKVTLTATPNTGYQFVGWYNYDGSVEYSKENPYRITNLNGDNYSVYAYFREILFDVKVDQGYQFTDPFVTARVGITSHPTIRATKRTGKVFYRWETTGSVVLEDYYNSQTRILSVSDNQSTVTATYKDVPYIYYDITGAYNNGSGWTPSTMYVYFYNSAYWNDTKGSGFKDRPKHYGQMEKVNEEGTLWRYKYDPDTIGTITNIAFMQHDQSNNEYFQYNEGSYCAYHSCNNMFVVTKTGSYGRNNTNYRNDDFTNKYGYWSNYGETEEARTGLNSGFYLNNLTSGSYSEEFIDENGDGVFTVVANLSPNTDYGFYLGGCGGGQWSNKDLTLTATNKEGSFYIYNDGVSGKFATLHTTVGGFYTFKLTPQIGDGSEPRLSLEVEFPVAANDYRATVTKGGKKFPSNIIKSGESSGTISLWLANGDNTVNFDYATLDGSGNVTWNANGSQTVNVGKNGVYTMTLAKTGTPRITDVEEYTGNFYIRTDCAPSGWQDYEDNKLNKNDLTFSTSDAKTFNYYYCKWVPDAGTNVQCVIANDFNMAISDTLKGEEALGGSGPNWNQTLPEAANVRFSYNSYTNEVKRAYIAGSTNPNDRFLILHGNTVDEDNKVLDTEGNTINHHASYDNLNENEEYFLDRNNWVYQVDVKAKSGAAVYLTAHYNNADHDLYGASDDLKPVLTSSNTSTTYDIQVTYDFKTNNLMTTWRPGGGTIVDQVEDAPAVMILRDHQQQAEQIKFGKANEEAEMGSIANTRVYGTMQFNKYTLNNQERTGTHAPTSLSEYERALYWISFPFDVNLRDVFGFGQYGKHWIVEYYDGDERASKGWWAEIDGFWKFVSEEKRETYVLEKGVGYVLALDLDEMRSYSSVWNNSVTDVYLYFPSATTVDISNDLTNLTIDVPEHNCSITRDSRNTKDSHWNVIGVPIFENTEGLVRSDGANFLYVWNPSDNTYNITPHETPGTLKTMSAYLVQFAGQITWSNHTANLPSSVAAQTRSTEMNFKLELTNGETSLDHTYICMSNKEGVTNGFEFGKDITKYFNTDNNIYTLIGEVEVGGNVMPLSEQTTVVPVGVKIASTGDYTFTLPDGAEGIGIILVDNEANTRTNLALTDYTVNLTAGKIDGRFSLEISPIVQNPTDVEVVNGQNSAVRKVMVDGILYIVKDGVIYDARGNRVQ